MLMSLAEHYKFDVEAPYDTLSPAIQKIILYGSGKETIEFKYRNDRGDITVRRHPLKACSIIWNAVIKKQNQRLSVKN